MWLDCIFKGLKLKKKMKLVFQGSISRLEVNGAMKVKNFLHGSPQLKIILNDNVIVQRNSRIKGKL